MAKESARSAQTPSIGRSAGQIWQLPTFVLGLAALWLVTQGPSLLTLDPQVRWQRELDALRAAVERTPPDLTTAAERVERILARLTDTEANSATVAFLLGSYHVAVAQQLGDAPEAKAAWLKARSYLEDAEQRGVAETDQLKLLFRLGKTWAHVAPEVPRQKVIDYLTRSVQASDDPAEGHRLLAEIYLSLQPPDLRKARESLREQLARALPRTDPRILHRARIKLGELHLALNDVDEARKILERVGPDAPAEDYAHARGVLARTYQAEARDPLAWNRAIQCWEQARDAVAGKPALRLEMMYRLGECQAKAGRRKEAIATWAEASSGGGSGAQASAVQLARARIADRDTLSGIATLEAILQPLPQAEAWNNPLLPLAELRQLVEEAIGILRGNGQTEEALRLIRLYGKIAPNGKDRELAAEVAEERAEQLLQQASIEPNRKAELEKQANALLVQVGNDLLLAAQKQMPQQADTLRRRAAQFFLRASDSSRAIGVLGDLVQQKNLTADQRAELWAMLGEAHLIAGNTSSAREAFQQSLQASNGPGSAKARLRLAKLRLDSRQDSQIDQAIAELELNLDPSVLQQDRSTHEESCYLIADALFHKRDYRKAEARLKDALQSYPDSKYAITARYQLGRCYWYQASQEGRAAQEAQKQLAAVPMDKIADREVIQSRIQLHMKQYREYLQRAVVPMQMVEAPLARKPADQLTPAEALLLKQASIHLAEYLFYLGEYEQSVQAYAQVAVRYEKQVEQLIALSQMWQCYERFLDQPDKARDVLARMRQAFQEMPDAAFNQSTALHHREYWKKWFSHFDAVPATPPR